MIAIAPQRRGLAALRWATAALAVASVHGGMTWVALNWRPAEAAAGAPEPAVMIELAAVSVAPEAPAEELPVAPEKVEQEQPPEPVKETPPEPPPEPEPTPIEQPEIKLPELPSIPQLDAVLLPPPPDLKPPPKKIVEKKEKPKPKIVRRPVEPDRPKAREAAAPEASTPRAAAPSAAAQGTASQPSVSNASWRGMLIAHLNRYKRFPGGANPGTVQVAFSIDRGGRVLSSRVVGSSGNAALDEEAAAMIRRASPVPAPPAGVGGGGTISLSVPVRFNR